MKKSVIAICTCLIVFAAFHVSARADEDEVEGVVRSIYQKIGVEPGRIHTIEELQTLWHENATLAFPNPDGSLRIQKVDEFITGLRNAVEEGPLGELGFREEVGRIEVAVYGNIAQAKVHYRLFAPADAPEFAREGIDMIQLVKVNGGWLVFSLVNQVTTTGIEPPRAVFSEAEKDEQ